MKKDISFRLTQMISDSHEAEMIPLLSPEEEQEMNEETFEAILPVLTLRNAVLYPGVVIPITVGRKKSIHLVKSVYEGNGDLAVTTQKTASNEDPHFDDIYKVGTAAKILKLLSLPDGNTTVILQGKRRVRINELISEEPFLTASITTLEEDFPDVKEENCKALIQSLKDLASKIIHLSPELPQEAKFAIDNIETPGFLTHFLASNLNVDNKIKQEILEIDNGSSRINFLMQQMMKEIQMLELKKQIQSKVHLDIDQQQRDYFLRQQIKIIQDELGDVTPEKDLDNLQNKALDKKWPETVKLHFFKELNKLKRINSSSPEYSVSMNYCETLVDLPWDEVSEDNFDLKRAKKILDDDHYGLEKVKDRIVEYLAVLKLKNVIKGNNDGKMRGPILCLYGPPGVGKTSLGKSIAKALNREYVRMSLGGIRDEAEIRGHRKTYIGAMPGKLIQNIQKSGTSNPVFILDEIDKIGTDFRGDPSSAFLEVLDPEQNSDFVDNYIEVGYDLSKVLFVATSNSLDTIQPALRDRMEIIEVSGYTLEEKIEISKRHLIPKQLEENGMDNEGVSFTKAALNTLVDGFTRESGVRGLERKIASVVRNLAKKKALEEELNLKVDSKDIIEILGAPIFERESYDNNQIAGIVTGLAWTSVGGEILSIETLLSKGKGKITISGQLGDVMKESAVAALSNLRSKANQLNIDDRIFDQYDLHLHVPAGAVPKDGPSAGITMFTSLASVFTQRKVKSKLAMTGEITLSGKVLPVGGIKEKILAAKRAGIQEIALCYKNKKDIEEIKADYIKGLNIHYVKTVDDVLEIALMDELVKNPLKFKFEEAPKNN
jgi:ATP-dependent Lon protease